jgi:hypothetical protein
MTTNRRDFFSRLFGAGATVTALTALAPVLPKEAEAIEVRSDRKYVFAVDRMTAEARERLEQRLTERGLDAILVTRPLEIFELQKEESA